MSIYVTKRNEVFGIKDKYFYLVLLFLPGLSLIAQPANNNCIGVINLTVFTGSCGGASAGTTTAATASNISPAPSCGNLAIGMDDDVWYSFTPGVGQTLVNINFTSTGGSTDMYAQIYTSTGGCAGPFIQTSCSDDFNGLMPGWSNLTVTPAVTYYMRVATYSTGNNGQFTVCISTPPAAPSNNNCVGATVITAYNSSTCGAQTAGTTISATQSQTGCVGTADDDVWYCFVATNTTHIITISSITGSSTDLVHQIFSGPCTSLTSLACTDFPDNTTVTGLTIGQTYYVRVYTYFTSANANFNICITAPPPPPANDNPCGAISLPVNTSCSYTAGTNVNATNTTTVGSPACANYTNADVWFSFVVPASGSVTIDLSAGGITDSGLAIYSGSNCNTLTLIECDDDDGVGLMSQIVRSGLTPGTTIWVRVWEFGGDLQGSFGICVYDNNPTTPCGNCTGSTPTNDACTGAYNLGALPTPAACPGTGLGSAVSVPVSVATNSCATHENPYSVVSGCSTTGSDVWYRFDVTGSTLVINMTSLLTQANVSLWQLPTSGNCNSLISRGCVQSANGNITNYSFSNLTNGTYYLQVSGGTAADRCNFNLSLQNNNDCNACIQTNNLTVSPPPVNGTYAPGTEVTFCYTISSYNQTAANWLHGVSPVLGSGWSNLIPSGSGPTSVSGTWGWYTSVQGTAICGGCGILGGPGWYFETTLGNNGIGTGPGNNFGDPNITGTGSWTFCWKATVLPATSCPGINGASLSVNVFTYGDSQTGSWNSAACQSDPNYFFYATVQCCSLSAVIGGGGTVCQGSSSPVEVSFTGGTAPYTFTYTANGTPTTVTTSLNPYIINGTVTGTYLLTSLSSVNCNFGTVSGTGNVTIVPRPTAILSGDGFICGTGGTSNLSITVTGFNGVPFTINYINTTTSVSGSVSGSSSPVFVSVSAEGVYQLTSISATQNSVTCTGTVSGSANIVFNPVPAPPSVLADSTCGPGVANLLASGCSGGTINWFSGPSSSTVINTGSTFMPTLSATTTFYVECLVSGCSSTRVPVTATYFGDPPTPVLSANIAPDICDGQTVTYTATPVSSIYLYQFFVNGSPFQGPGISNTYTFVPGNGQQTISVIITYAFQ